MKLDTDPPGVEDSWDKVVEIEMAIPTGIIFD